MWPLFTVTTVFLVLGSVFDPSHGELDPNNRYRQGRRVIETHHGKVQGLLVEFPNNKKVRPVEVYLGLQYASLLGSRLRFMPPTNPVEKWKGLRMLMTSRPACPQKRLDEEEVGRKNSKMMADRLNRIAKFTRHQTEDCLSLNIYVPTQDNNDTSKLPVMVFLHGESYDSGTGNAYDGSVLASYGQVIVITLNYRLGILGYLTAGENTNIASGNYALLDIIAALHWVKENIANFSGDPGKVTLFGHGYGAALVNLLLVSPLTKDGKLFQRGIIQSGSALSSWAVADDPVSCTRMLAEAVNCSQHLHSAQALVSCLRTHTTDDLVRIAPESPKYFNCFAPSVSTRSSVIPRPVHALHEARDTVFGKGSLMFGLTKNEAVSYFTEEEASNGISALRKAQIIRTYVHNTFKYHRQKIYEILDHHYTEWDRGINNVTRRNAVMELLSDGQYVAPLIKVGNYHEGLSSSYFYNFAYSSKIESHRHWSGGVHGEELSYVFGAPLVGGIAPFQTMEYSKTERQLSEAVMTYWSNFAKSGNPNEPVKQIRGHGKFQEIQWSGYTAVNQTFLQISMRPKLGMHYRGRQLALWLDLIPKLHKTDGADPKEHLLKDYHNMTTFDSPEKLVHIDNLFPPPTTTTTSRTPFTTGEGSLRGTIDSRDISASNVDSTQLNPNQEITMLPPSHHSEDGGNISTAGGFVMGDHSVQVSITIAVGCSLLFLNILIFAGIYYQRERIKKLKKPPVEAEGLRLNRKPDEENGRGNGPETISLLSTPLSHSPHAPHYKGDPDCGHTQPIVVKSQSAYVPMHKLPSFSSTPLTKPTVTIGPNSRMTNPYQKPNHRISQVSVHHTKGSEPFDSNSAVTIV